MEDDGLPEYDPEWVTNTSNIDIILVLVRVHNIGDATDRAAILNELLKDEKLSLDDRVLLTSLKQKWDNAPIAIEATRKQIEAKKAKLAKKEKKKRILEKVIKFAAEEKCKKDWHNVDRIGSFWNYVSLLAAKIRFNIAYVSYICVNNKSLSTPALFLFHLFF